VKRAELTEFFEERGVVLFDAAMGTALIAAGMPSGMGSEEMNLSAPDTVFRIHCENIEAGSDVVTSNTFGVSQMMIRGKKEGALEALREAVCLAKQAASGRRSRLACLCVGPVGELLGPLGDVSYEAAAELFALQAEAGAAAGADFIMLETFADAEEFAHAAVAAVGASDLPVLGTMTFGENCRSFMGASPIDVARRNDEQAIGLFALGANCTLGPEEIVPVVKEFIDAVGGLPVIAQPNAGLPVYKAGGSVYEMTPADFAAGAEKLLALGISAIGGCCGTTPDMIALVRGIIDKRRNER